MTEERKLEIFQYRVGLALGIIAYPFFGWFSENFLKVDFDSLTRRLPVAFFCLVTFFLSFKLKIVEKYLRLLVMIACCWCMYDYIGFFAQSNYHFYFSIGLTAMPFIIFTFLFHPVDIVIFFIFMLSVGANTLKDSNVVFIVTYLILMVLAFSVYLLVTRNRLNLLRKVKENLEQIKMKQSQIDEKNKSLIKIGELATQVAHDIRSPVTALEAVAQMLGDEIDPQKKKLIKNVAKRINDIANNLVSEYRENLTNDLSSMQIDRTIAVNNLIEDVIEEKNLLLDSRHKINLIAPESISIPAKLDISEFQRLISNIINNSIESFDKQNGSINIELSRNQNKIKVKIQDNGKGIPTEKLGKVFEKGHSSKSQGAGLGLSHAKEYIESLGGTIAIQSIIGSGTIIEIYL